MEQIEKLKFQQDVKSGISYFDQIKSVARAGQAELSLLKERYEQNVKVLSEIAKVEHVKKIKTKEAVQEIKLDQKMSKVVSLESIQTTTPIEKS